MKLCAMYGNIFRLTILIGVAAATAREWKRFYEK